MKRRYFCQTVRDDSLVVRSSDRIGSLVFRTTGVGGGLDVYLNPTQVSDLISLLQTWVINKAESLPLWEDE